MAECGRCGGEWFGGDWFAEATKSVRVVGLLAVGCWLLAVGKSQSVHLAFGR